MEPGSELGSIKTFVFLDIESTHLESLDRPKMMELCLVAVHRSELLESFHKHKTTTPLKEIHQLRIPTARVVDSLTLCMDPGKAVSPVSFQITGLDNLNLSESGKPRFGETEARILKLFLARQEEPVCLLAHNGFKFDFPLIKTELENINSSLSSTIVCGDTLCAFRETEDQECATPRVMTEGENRMPTPSPNLLLSAGKDGNNKPTAARNLFPSDNEVEKKDLGMSINGDTSKTNMDSKKVYRTSHQCYNQNNHRFSLVSTTDALFTLEEGVNNSYPKRDETPSNASLSFSLPEIYRRNFKEYPKDSSHQATNDVMALIAVFIPIAKSLIEYFDVNSVPFQTITPYYVSPLRKRAASPVACKQIQHDGRSGAGNATKTDDKPPFSQWKKRKTQSFHEFD
ncbi:Three prime repair exonuclease 2 [Holothuria leucospilota]|uniref:Three prime repair exonuclease 2 n=1 Tax=Holothuria leucospilota TaxID=206669 RepID=A0A9Q1C3G2_HOLLE|nr:Three prime repair exonuclease 2 [Holothuria leucospilota]